nr:hypothetical protein [Phycisphaerales bacterium]
MSNNVASHASAAGVGHHHDFNPDHAREGLACCSHHEIEIERYIMLCLVGCVLLLSTWIVQILGLTDDHVAVIPAAIGAVVMGIPLFTAAIKELRTGLLSSSTLAALAILAALATGQFVAGGWLAFILVIFGQLVRRSASGAQRAIQELVQLTPDTARLVENGQEREIRLAEVKVGSLVRVRAGENLPVDGKVVTGRSTVNQASLTGEAVPVEVAVGDLVYAGTTNLTGGLDISVTQVGEDTTIGKVTQLIRQAEQSRTPRQMLIEQVSRFFVPVVLSVTAVVWFLMSQSENP